MGAETNDLMEVVAQLPEAKRAEVADFARFLLARESNQAWERELDDPKPRPKLDAFLAEAGKEPASPLDPDRL